MVVLLRQLDGLRRFVAHLHAQATFGRRYRQLAIPQAPHQVEGLAQRLLVRQPQRVLLHCPLDRRAHLRRRPEEAVGRHQPAERLVRPLEVVRVHEEPDAFHAVGEICEDRLAQKLVPERLPETLDLPECLRVLRAALDVPNALAA